MYLLTKYLSNNTANITDDIRSNFTYVEDPPWRLSHNQFFTNCHSSEPAKRLAFKSWNPVSFKGFYFYDSLIFIVLRQSQWRNKSNRLKKVERYNTKYFDLAGEYSYDPDGNFTSLTRSYNSDNFSYDYYSGTNRLKKVTGSTDQYTYDYNGNQTNDYINNNTGIKYDHRNLITEFTRQDLTQDPPITDITRYKYDEAGNRVRKTIYRSTDSEPTPLPEETEDLPTGWSIILDDYYLREVSGKEIAIYSSYTLQYWNVWSGSEIVGRINNTENVDRNYYLKDHLGSVRVVLDNSKTIVSANDYDMWGYYLQDRTYSTTNVKNKFTGKERDLESSYDYFGARYYDARMGRWGGVEPLIDKYISYSTYQYGLLNPLRLVDADGLDLYLGGDKTMALVYLQSLISSENSYRLTLDDNGKVGFNTDGLSLSSDVAYNLLNEMINVSKNNYLFEVASKTEGFTRALGSDERGDIESLNVEDISGNHRSGVFNLSKTQKMKDYIANYDYLPKIGFDGQVTLGCGYWLTLDGKYYQPKSNIIFHELAENYYRTEKGKYYVNTTDQKEGAHYLSIKLAEKYRKQEGKAGEGRYVPYK